MREHHVAWFVDGIGEVRRQWENYDGTNTLVHGADISLVDTNITSANNAQKDDGENCNCSAGDPINYGSGNHYQVESDYEGTGPFPLSITRFYNSRSSVNTDLGLNWRHNYSARVLFVTGTTQKTAIMKRPNGRVYSFRQNGSVWTADADISGRFAAMLGAGGNVMAATYTTDTDNVETYDAKGKLLSIKNRSGLVQTLVYEPTGLQRLLSIKDSFGRQLKFAYDSNNRLSRITDPAGLLITYGYDSSNRLVSVMRQDGSVRRYGYNEAAYTNGANLPHALTSLTDENNAVYTIWRFDDSGRALSSEHAGSAEKTAITYNTDGSRTLTDAFGNNRSLTVQTILGRSKNLTLSNVCATCTDGLTASKTYDANGNVATRTDFNGNVTTYAYDLSRNLETRRVEASGTNAARTITTEWHGTYRLPTRIAEPNKLTTYTYDAKGNLRNKTEQATSDATGSQGFAATVMGTARTWSHTYNNVGLVSSATNPLGNTTSYSYDIQGNLTAITNAAGQVTSLSNYDANGHVGRITDANGVTTGLTYSPRGWLTAKTTGGEITNYAYDGAGQLKQVTLPDGSAINYTYDDAHRLTDVTDSMGNSMNYTLDAMGNRITEQARDAGGTLVRQIIRVYDALNRLQQITGGEQ